MNLWRLGATALVIANLVTACGGQPVPTPTPEAVGCVDLLKGRGFAGHMLVSQEPAPGRGGAVYCVFVAERYRAQAPGTQVPGRRVLYDSAESLISEQPVTVPVTGDFTNAPGAS